MLREIAQQVFRLPSSFPIPLVLALITNSILRTCFRSRPTIIKLLFILVLGLALINRGNFKDGTSRTSSEGDVMYELDRDRTSRIFFFLG